MSYIIFIELDPPDIGNVAAIGPFENLQAAEDFGHTYIDDENVRRFTYVKLQHPLAVVVEEEGAP